MDKFKMNFAIFAAVFTGLLTVTPVSCQEIDQCDVQLLGRLGSGVMRSPNYPFNYTNGLNCRLSIVFDPDELSSGRLVCFTFHRFQLDSGGSEGDCYGDYLAFRDEGGQEVFYCGAGNVRENQAMTVQNDRQNVFSENFCWPAAASNFLVVFFSNSVVNNTGFYADYQVTYQTADEGSVASHSIAEETQQQAGTNAMAPCAVDQYTCFNRQCVPSSYRCDGTDDCGDGSDEDYLHGRCPDTQDVAACDLEDTNTYCAFSPINWIKSSTSPNGPRYDHTIRSFDTGDFLYNWYVNNNYATLRYERVPIERTTTHCLSLWYYMSGQVGTLLVNITSEQQADSSTLVWYKDGNQGAEWKRFELEIPAEQFPLQELTIYCTNEMQDVPAYANIGLDDISLVPGQCHGEDLNCDFELSFCSWENDPGGPLPWIRHKGPTESENTGPESDRTGFGYYIYMEASDGQLGQYARLISHSISNLYSDEKCLMFWYYMYGDTVNSLSILIRDYKGDERSLWTRYNNHGPQWMEGKVTVFGQEFTGPYQLIIEAAMGEDLLSDIAVDDLQLVKGFCSQATTTRKPVATVEPCPSERPFLCGSGQCLPQEWVCDGRNDCPDHSDEDGCDTSSIQLSAGAIIGISCGGAVLLVFITVTVVCVRKKGYPASIIRSRTRSRGSIAPSEFSYTDLYWQQFLGARGDMTVEADSQVSLDPPPPYSLPGTPGNSRPPTAMGGVLQPPPYSPGGPLTRSGSLPRFRISIYPEHGEQDHSPPPQYNISIYSSLHNTMDLEYENPEDLANITATTRNDVSHISISPMSAANVTLGGASVADTHADLNMTAATLREMTPGVSPIGNNYLIRGPPGQQENPEHYKIKANNSWRSRFRLSKRGRSGRGAPPELARALARLQAPTTAPGSSREQTRHERAMSVLSNSINMSLVSQPRQHGNQGANRLAGHGALQPRNVHNDTMLSINVSPNRENPRPTSTSRHVRRDSVLPSDNQQRRSGSQPKRESEV